MTLTASLVRPDQLETVTAEKAAEVLLERMRETPMRRGALPRRAHYGNVVDEPAIDWLARQEKPRLWVCDGMVTGRGDAPSLPIAERIAKVCRRAKILRLNNIEKLEEWLERSRRGRKTIRNRKGKA